MRYLELLIDRAREMSQNERYDANSGVSQRTFVQYAQNAQDFVMREIINSKTKYFLEPVIIPVVNNQEEYDYPVGIVLQGIDTIEWSQDQVYWNPLEKCIAKDRTTSMTGYPFGYILNRRKIIVTPFLTFGFLRITFNKKPKRLEKRSAQVLTVTGTPITSIEIDPSFEGDDQTYLNKFNTLSIVGRDGVPKVTSIPITACDSDVITVSNYTLLSGETIAAGDFVLAEGSTTNLPDYDDMIESVLVLHMTYQAKYGDSSQWSRETRDDMASHMKQIIAAFGSLSEDVNSIPIVNEDFLSLW